MSIEANKSVVRRFTKDFINTGNETVAEELIAPDAVLHVPGKPELHGPAGYLQVVREMRGGFSDAQFTLEDLLSEGNMVAARFTMRGTHDGDFHGIPPSNRPFVVTSMVFSRIVDGKIAEGHGLPDILSILKQMGALPL